MTQESVNIQVSDGLIKPIIEAKIQAAIVSALDGSEKHLIESAIAAILNQKVDEEGKPPRYDNGKYTFLQYLCKQAIKAAANDAVREWCETHQKELKDTLLSQMRKQKSSLANAFVEGLARSIQSQWLFKCDVSFKTPKDYE